MTKEISLTQGKFALVDDIDYDFLMQWKWHAHKNGQTYYATRILLKNEEGWVGGHQKAVHMHRVILERKLKRKLEDNELCDHISGEGLDNRRDNLRVADARLNAQNRHIKQTSKYFGVHLRKDIGKYRASINIKEKCKNLGHFDTQEEAYEKYCEACKIIKSGDKEAIKELMAPVQYSSKYKGVTWDKRSQKWKGYFTINKKRYYVGYFDDEYKAHVAVEKEKSLHMRGNK